MGINSDTILIKGRIAEKRDRIKKLAISAGNHIITVRNKVDANAYDKDEDFTDLDMESAMAAMNDLYDVWTKAKELRDEIARLEKSLNG